MRRALAAGIAVTALFAVGATVSDVSARQRSSCNGLVDIDYTLCGETSGLAAGIAVTALFAVGATVSDVSARQRDPCNGLVDIDYTLCGETSGLAVDITVTDHGTGRTYRPTDGVREIWGLAFGGCASLRTVRLPMSVSGVFWAFKDCGALEFVKSPDVDCFFTSNRFVVCHDADKRRYFEEDAEFRQTLLRSSVARESLCAVFADGLGTDFMFARLRGDMGASDLDAGIARLKDELAKERRKAENLETQNGELKARNEADRTLARESDGKYWELLRLWTSCCGRRL